MRASRVERQFDRLLLVVGVGVVVLVAAGALALSRTRPGVSLWAVSLESIGLAGLASASALGFSRGVPWNDASPALHRGIRRAWLAGLAVVLALLALTGQPPLVLVLVGGGALVAMLGLLEPALARLRRHAEGLERLALAARKTKTGIVITDTDRRIEWVNTGWAELTGIALDDARGEDPGDLLRVPSLTGRHEQHNLEARTRMRAALALGRASVRPSSTPLAKARPGMPTSRSSRSTTHKATSPASSAS